MLTPSLKSSAPAMVSTNTCTCDLCLIEPGTYAHLVFTTFGLMTNILVTSMLLTGGSAVVHSLTGVPTAAACFLLPVGVVLYTMFGGIKATFLTDYVHTVIILVILLVFVF